MSDKVLFLDLKKVNDSFQPELSEAIEDVVKSGWYLLGKKVEKFEQEYARYIGTSQCISCGNGLDALTLIFKAYVELGRLRTGDEVLVPANTYIATFLAISEAGLIPIPVDVDPITLQIDLERMKEAFTSKTRAVALVHLYGRCAYTEEIANWCKANRLITIEDNAQAAGCLFDDARHTGSLCDAAGHSFYPGKNLGALGDGGAVTTNDEDLAHTVRTLAFYGSKKKYIFDYIGRNSRLDEIQAAALSIKLPRLDADNQRRREIAEIYQQEIKNPIISLPYPDSDKAGTNNVFHLFPILSEKRDEIKDRLEKIGIQTLIHYPVPPHLQKCYDGRLAIRYPLPNAEMIARSELSLPISQVMEDWEVEKVIEALNSFS